MPFRLQSDSRARVIGTNIIIITGPDRKQRAQRKGVGTSTWPISFNISDNLQVNDCDFKRK